MMNLLENSVLLEFLLLNLQPTSFLLLTNTQGAGSRAVATMAKKSVGDLSRADLEGKVVFVRADLNVRLLFLWGHEFIIIFILF